MKGLTITGLIFLAIAVILFYFNFNFSFDRLINFNFLIGVFTGLGLGQLIGGIIGYVSKGSAVKEAARKQKMTQLQKEKQELERQAAALSNTNNYNNPQI